MKFILLSDMHHISRRLMCENPDTMLLRHQYAAATALKMASRYDDTDTIIITGDLTEHGDRYSHNEFIKMLRELKARGKKVYVLTATHDFNLGRAFTNTIGNDGIYSSKPWENAYFDPEIENFKDFLKEEYKSLPKEEYTPNLSPACTRAELWEMYKEFGREQAISVCDEGASYCVELDEDTWCLMLNDDFRDPDKNGVDSTYTRSCFRWMKETVKEAKAKGKYIFACTHHPLVPPVPAYKIGGADKDMRRAFIGHILADMGLDLVFSGHTHFCDIGYMTSEKGNSLYNITTPSVATFPPQFRTVELDGLKGKVKTEIIEVEKPDGLDFQEKTFKEYLKNNFYSQYENVVKGLGKSLGDLILSLKLKHFYPLCRFSAKISKEEYTAIKETRFFDVIMELVFNMLCGDGQYTPNTPEYKFIMGFCAVLDSIINAQPFFDLKKKVLHGYSISQIVEPMLFNNYIPDGNAEFDFTVAPEKKWETPEFKSHAGEILMAILCILAIPLAVLSPIAAIITLPILTLKKKSRERKNPTLPERY